MTHLGQPLLHATTSSSRIDDEVSVNLLLLIGVLNNHANNAL